MRIEEIRFENLNSLYGKWKIDLNASEYLSNGIFAITGATGAGKSTILDAICLALYGATPRLKNISKSSNEIMSRQTGECSAEVIFRIGNERYRCHWAQHRSRRKPDGKLADSKHEISDVETGKILAEKKRDVAAEVIRITGMDLDRFTRSMLLAQGSFAAFLKATADERSPILEQITGTEIYSTISKRVHERQREEQEKYNLLVAGSQEIKYLTDEEEDELKATIDEGQSSLDKLKKESEELVAKINWKNRVKDLNEECKKLEQNIKQIKEERESFKPERLKLEKGVKAGEILETYTRLNDLKKRVQIDHENLEKAEKREPVLKESETLAEAQVKSCSEMLNQMRTENEKTRELFTKVRELDRDITQKGTLLKELNVSLGKIVSESESHEKDKREIETQLIVLKEQNSEVKIYLEKNSSDESLTEELGAVNSKKDRIKQLSDDIYILQAKLDRGNSNLREKKEKFASEQCRLKDKQMIVSGLEVSLEKLLNGRLEREYHNELESLYKERSLTSRIQSLEEDRKILMDGEPCPLCGSKEHPYAVGNMPELNELDKKIEALKVLLDSLSAKHEEIKAVKAAADAVGEEVRVLESEAIRIETEYNHHQEELKKSETEHEGLVADLLSSVAKYGIRSVESLPELEKREALWRDCFKRDNSFQQEKIKLEGALDKAETALTMVLERKKELQDSIFGQSSSLKELQSTRKELFGDKNPDIEESKNNQQVKELELKLNIAKENFEKSGKELFQCRTLIESLGSKCKEASLEFDDLEKQFESKLKERGFSRDEFENSILSLGKIKELTSRMENLDKRFSEVSIRLDDRSAALEKEQALNLTDSDVSKLKEFYNISSQKQRVSGEELGALKSTLQTSFENRQKMSERVEEINKQKLELENWQKLHSLIGSADGKKYRNFAQGLTFEQMVAFANRELIKLSDRYLLIRDRDNPLELNVVDNYQAGEIRSTKNLSGGESFIVSLALALGLSNMAGSKVRVDSLFLDEGFGTLDEDALEVALDTLATLHQSGKIIGVISHVPGLKERISTQISVTKNSGGRGVISGPGCMAG